ncbi:hypothetical protein P6U16_06565 [Rhizobium sp. 32-5/1]|uniref:hypothetical protein n=1 Tax=Rhizobium sp. 32-5/1 TaxID=3019602 RepID=UPI00240DB968|nr:hypothetical protein [Rhizobium sp. 32-5/1]WEZ84306.1 hypothetical protein P6U16_06565 [Rhizobium sp. 32-5/1]
MRALDLIETLSSEYKLQKPERPDYYDPRADFLRRITRITQARHRRQEGEAAQKAKPPISPRCFQRLGVMLGCRSWMLIRRGEGRSPDERDGSGSISARSSAP